MPEIPTTKQVLQLERNVNNAANADKLARAYAERGTLRSSLGSDEEGLKDLLRAHAVFVDPKRFEDRANLKAATLDDLRGEYDSWADKGGYEPDGKWSPHAQLAEAFRTYARESLLSLAPDCDDTACHRTLVSTAVTAIKCFERAALNLELVPTNTSPADQSNARAWIAAHRAACFVLLYWMRRSATKDQQEDKISLELFARADAGFTIALEEKPQYVWAIKFKAFSLALRGGPRGDAQMSDSRRARLALRRLEENQPGALDESSLQRSVAMLFAYDVGDVFKKQIEAATAKEQVSATVAADGIDAATKCMEAAAKSSRDGVDEPHAPLYGTIGAYYMAKYAGTEEERAHFTEALRSTLRVAEVRARNAFSQNLATLASLEELREHLYQEKSTVFRNLLDDHKFGADLETRCAVMRNPLNQLIGPGARQKVLARFAVPLRLTDTVLDMLDAGKGGKKP